MACETLFEGGKNADVGVGVALALRACVVIAEERFNAVGEFGCLLPIDVNDQGRAFSLAVVDDEREFVEAVRVPVGLEFVGDGVSEIVESLIRRGAIHDSPGRWPGAVLQLSSNARGRGAG